MSSHCSLSASIGRCWAKLNCYFVELKQRFVSNDCNKLSLTSSLVRVKSEQVLFYSRHKNPPSLLPRLHSSSCHVDDASTTILINIFIGLRTHWVTAINHPSINFSSVSLFQEFLFKSFFSSFVLTKRFAGSSEGRNFNVIFKCMEVVVKDN